MAANTATSCGTTCENLVACEVEQGCRAGTCEPSGLAEFSIPFTAAGQTQRYGASHSTAVVNLTNDIVNVRLYAPGATGGSINIYLNGQNGVGPGVILALSTLSSGWQTIAIPVGGINGNFDPVAVRQVTFDVMSGDTGPWTNPTLIYVDRIWSDNLNLNDRFVSQVTPPGVISGATAVSGATLAWRNIRP
jgi:hypothetical protein